jgi:hypothetical protein
MSTRRKDEDYTLTKLELLIFSRGSYDGKICPHEWHNVITIISEFEHFLIRVSISCQIRDGLTPALPHGTNVYYKRITTACARVILSASPVMYTWLCSFCAGGSSWIYLLHVCRTHIFEKTKFTLSLTSHVLIYI